MSTDLGRLAAAVKSRRLALYTSRVAAAQSVGISKDTWKRVEDGEIVRDGTYVKIDEALKWAPGSCAAILEGRTAMPVQDVEGEPGTVTTTVSGEALNDEVVRDVVQLASIATTGLPADEIRALANRVVHDLKKLGLI
ncbi:helix-turn-helix transcriptional regulator [Streptomyces sp. MZ04]|uniref:helix-turn-helix domain-containing protein n=1 Tax=Streptomyces sp. MZ04 TaxID=2559236 RepID=UPI00107EADC1|nr:helix-turn-helix transcriptional regulator [Streptomyces sp. MZ04]TGB11601.1 XRE family transcriptional regulator [Streptomyces sp. MZ04]